MARDPDMQQAVDEGAVFAPGFQERIDAKAQPDPDPEEYDNLRRLIVLVRLNGEESARTCSAMLSLLDRKRRAGDPCPGYVGLYDEAEALYA